MTKVLPLSRGKDFKLAERNDFSDNEDDLSADEEMRKSLFHGSGNAGGKTIQRKSRGYVFPKSLPSFEERE